MCQRTYFTKDILQKLYLQNKKVTLLHYHYSSENQNKIDKYEEKAKHLRVII